MLRKPNLKTVLAIFLCAILCFMCTTVLIKQLFLALKGHSSDSWDQYKALKKKIKSKKWIVKNNIIKDNIENENTNESLQLIKTGCYSGGFKSFKEIYLDANFVIRYAQINT